jgi:hypothetical protein
VFGGNERLANDFRKQPYFHYRGKELGLLRDNPFNRYGGFNIVYGGLEHSIDTGGER